MKDWEVIIMMETWLDEKGWEKMKGRLPRNYKWGVQYAERKNRKGKAMGGIIMEVSMECYGGRARRLFQNRKE